MIGIRLGANRSEAAAVIGGKPMIIAMEDGLNMKLLYENANANNLYAMQEETARLISRLVSGAKNYLRKEVDEVLLCVPGNVDQKQKVALMDAGRIAGVRIKRICTETALMGLAINNEYCQTKGSFEGEYLAVACDEHVCEVSLFAAGDEVVEILATVGAYEPAGISAQKLQQLTQKVFAISGVTTPFCAFATGTLANVPTFRDALIAAMGRNSVISSGMEQYGIYGAAELAAKLDGERTFGKYMFLNCTRNEIALRVSGEKTATLVPGATFFPDKESVTFKTTFDQQKSMKIEMFEIDAADTGKEKYLSTYVVGNIPAGKAGENEVEVKADIDADENVTISIKEKWSGVTKELKASGMTDEQIGAFAERLRHPAAKGNADNTNTSAGTERPGSASISAAEASAEAYTKGVFDTAMCVLSALDDLERGLDMLSGIERHSGFPKGVEQVCKQLRDQLEELGVKEIPAMGRRFNHDLHEAVEHITDPTYCEGQIVKVYVKGYTLNGKVIRYAKVAVTN